MGHIESEKFNPAYLIGSCYIKPGWSYLSQMRSMWNMNHIRIEKIVVVGFYFTNKHKQKRKSKQ